MSDTFDLYSREHRRGLEASFAAPGAVLRGTPFWSWNNRLNAAQLCGQIDILKTMGMGGGHMHSRTGMDTPYLGPEFMDCIRACVAKFRAEGMLAWLYDEDRWPSGAAGGLVTADARYRARRLVFTCRPDGGDRPERRRLASYEIRLAKGCLAHYRRLAEGASAAPGCRQWHALLETAGPDPWFNHQPYVDTLNPAAIRRFIELTHERYFEAVGAEFGKTIPAIFTDEPQFTSIRPLRESGGMDDIVCPFTDALPDTYRETYGEDLLERLPELFWELPDGRRSRTRYRYHDHVAENFAGAFADQIGRWCRDHGIALTGHLMNESSLGGQTARTGDAMRCYRAFQLPGIDMLADRREYNTAKQAQSAARQYGRPGVLSELYGVTDWDYPFSGHKSQGDWQAALGVTVRVHHLAWVSMAGAAKRDYPASIFHQSPWWRQYPVVEDHFARVNAVMTRGAPRVRLGVIHPIESYWLCSGPLDRTAAERREREDAFAALTEWLLFGLIDFDFISEALLPSLANVEAGESFKVGAMQYDIVLAPPMSTIRGATLERLEAFAGAGGRVIFCGEIPELVDAEPSARARALAARCTTIPFSRTRLLKALAGIRDLEILTGGAPADTLLYQMRAENGERYLFVCNTAAHREYKGLRLALAGEWQTTLLDTATGESVVLACAYEGGRTLISWDAPAHGHILLRLQPGRRETGVELKAPSLEESERLSDPVRITLHEPNVLLLDQAEWRLDGGGWRPREEILRLDNLVRAELGLPPRHGRFQQPWTLPGDTPTLGNLELRFKMVSSVAVAAPMLALEQPGDAQLFLNGEPVPFADRGWWVDDAIRVTALPDFGPGEHELTVKIRYHRRTALEAFYLQGGFGVRVRGRHAILTEAVRALAFGDWCAQDLPFYTGNVTYHCGLAGGRGPLNLKMPQFAGATVRVSLDGADAGPIAFAPYTLDLGDPEAGYRRLDITLFGNRFNVFGSLHRVSTGGWVGPRVWQSAGDDWSYEYRLRPLGILSAPRVLGALRTKTG